MLLTLQSALHFANEAILSARRVRARGCAPIVRGFMHLSVLYWSLFAEKSVVSIGSRSLLLRLVVTKFGA